MEIWRPIPSHLGRYEVSNLGRVRSVERFIDVAPSKQSFAGYRRKVRALVLKASTNDVGRLFVSLWRGHVVRQVGVHVLVLEAFIGPRPEGYYACHRNDVPSDNRLRNLYWGTPKQNSEDKVANGHQAYGERCSSAKLTAIDVKTIRAIGRSRTQVSIAKQFGIGQAQVSRILNRNQWQETA